LAEASSDLRQRVREPSEPTRLAALAHVLPLRMITILLAPGGIASDGLNDVQPESAA